VIYSRRMQHSSSSSNLANSNDQKEDQKALFKELQDQKQALDHAAIVAATDREGRITYVNQNFCRISEYSTEELLGQNHRIINSGYHSKDFFGEMWKLISMGKVWRGEIRNRAKSGRLYWVHTTVVPFLNLEGRPYQYLSIRQDITDLKEAEQTIRDQQTKMVAASKLSALGELSAVLTHEINNPLGVILGRTEMVLSALNSPNPNLATIKSMVESIETTGRRIEKIMKTVRALSHGGETEALQKVSLKTLIESALDILSNRIRNQGIRLDLELDQPDKILTCRPTELFQIMVNLLSNAHDAVQSLDDRWIKIRSFSQENSIQLQILDSGSGVSPEIAQKLFTPFFTTKQVGVGTGLGLTISHSLALRNGAKLSYEAENKNTCFVLNLPIKGPEAPLRS